VLAFLDRCNKELSARNIFLFSLSINALLFGAFFLTVTPGYETNDDIEMTMIASGFFDGCPSEYLVYVNVIIGNILRFAYNILPTVNWYTALIYLFHFASMVALLYSFLRVKRDVQGIFLFCVLFFLFELTFLAKLQYTSTAFVLVQSGIMLLIAFFKGKNRTSWLKISLSLLFFTMGILLRKEVFTPAFLLSLPIFALLFSKEKSLQIPLLLGTAVLLFWLANLYHASYYSVDSEWRDYTVHNKLASKIHSFRQRETEAFLLKSGWSQNDLEMFNSWFSIDRNVYSKESLRLLANHTPTFSRNMLTDELSMLNFRKYIYTMLFSYKFNTVCLGICLLFALGLIRERNEALCVALTFCVLVALTFYLHILGRWSARVLLPMFFLTSAIGFMTGLTPRDVAGGKSVVNKNNVRAMLTIISLVFVCLIFCKCSLVLELGKVHRRNNEKFNSIIELMCPSKDKLFVVWGASLPIEWISPYSNLSEYEKLKLLNLGWFNHSPIFCEIMRQFQIKDLYVALCDKENVLLVVRGERRLGWLRKYMSEHYGWKIEFNVISAGLVYKVRRQ
jgi:hypothetical protein